MLSYQAVGRQTELRYSRAIDSADIALGHFLLGFTSKHPSACIAFSTLILFDQGVVGSNIKVLLLWALLT